MFRSGECKARCLRIDMRSFLFSLLNEIAEGFDELILNSINRIPLLEERVKFVLLRFSR